MAIQMIPMQIKGPVMDASVPSTKTKPGKFGRLTGVDGRYDESLRKFYGMAEVLDIDGVSGMGDIDAYAGVSYFKAVTFHKKDTSSMYRGFRQRSRIPLHRSF